MGYAPRYQSLDQKIDGNQSKLETAIALLHKDLASTNQEGKHTRETLSNKIKSTHETLSSQIQAGHAQMAAMHAQAQISNMRWNITKLITLGGILIAIIKPWG